MKRLIIYPGNSEFVIDKRSVVKGNNVTNHILDTLVYKELLYTPNTCAACDYVVLPSPQVYTIAGVDYPKHTSIWDLIEELSTSGGGEVGLNLPVDVFNVTVSPVSTGTLTAEFQTQAAGEFFAGPVSGVDATPSFRAISANDLPDLSGLNGELSLTQIAQSGATPAQVIGWDGTQWTPTSVSGSIPNGTSAGQFSYWTGSAWAPTMWRKNTQVIHSGNTVTLPELPNSLLPIDVYLNGVLKEATVDYTIVGNLITFLLYSFITNDKITTKYYL